MITGASGLLGREFVKYCACKYVQVISLYQNHPVVEGMQNILPIQINLLDTRAVESVLFHYKPDIVIHCAGYTNVDACEENPELAMQLNAQVSAAIAGFAYSSKSQYVYISTDHLFQGDQAFYNEAEQAFPLNVYAKTKWLGEIYSLECNPDTLIIRTNFFGKGMHWRSSFSDWIWNTLSQGKQISAFVDSYFTPIALPHLVKLVHALIEKNATGIFNVCGSERLNKFEFAKRFAEKYSLPVGLIIPAVLKAAQLKAKRPLDMSLSTVKIEQYLGISAPSIEESLIAVEQDYTK